MSTKTLIRSVTRTKIREVKDGVEDRDEDGDRDKEDLGLDGSDKSKPATLLSLPGQAVVIYVLHILTLSPPRLAGTLARTKLPGEFTMHTTGLDAIASIFSDISSTVMNDSQEGYHTRLAIYTNPHEYAGDPALSPKNASQCPPTTKGMMQQNHSQKKKKMVYGMSLPGERRSPAASARRASSYVLFHPFSPPLKPLSHPQTSARAASCARHRPCGGCR